ncbi:hypothetical protein AAHE18_11G147200 [Arachis hypogaea]|nr:uncharacterized protein DS421_11g336760 [Arachis hypogaea]
MGDWKMLLGGGQKHCSVVASLAWCCAGLLGQWVVASCCATAAWVARNGALSAGWCCATAGCKPATVVLAMVGASWYSIREEVLGAVGEKALALGGRLRGGGRNGLSPALGGAARTWVRCRPRGSRTWVHQCRERDCRGER